MWSPHFNSLKFKHLWCKHFVTTICIPQLTSWLCFYLHVFIHKVCISTIKPWSSKKKVWNCESNMTYLASFIVIAVKVSSILIGCVWPAPANRSWCQSGRGGVRKTREPTGVSTTLQWQGGGVGGRSQIFLSPWVTYDLPSRFTCPQELAKNMVNHKKRGFCFLKIVHQNHRKGVKKFSFTYKHGLMLFVTKNHQKTARDLN